MGAIVRSIQAQRVGDKLPKGLDIPIIRILLKSYEDGDGTLDGVLLCIQKQTLLKFASFLREIYDDREGQSNDELVDELLDRIDDQLFIYCDDETKKERRRIIDNT